jgi:hypothetical protein
MRRGKLTSSPTQKPLAAGHFTQFISRFKALKSAFNRKYFRLGGQRRMFVAAW